MHKMFLLSTLTYDNELTLECKLNNTFFHITSRACCNVICLHRNSFSTRVRLAVRERWWEQGDTLTGVLKCV